MSSPITPPAQSPTAGSVPPLAPNWKATKDANGQVYYYNRVTRETRWDPPLAQPSPTATTASPSASQSSPVTPQSAPPTSAGALSAQPTIQSLSSHQTVEGSPSITRAANPIVTERVATLSRSCLSSDALSTSSGTGGGSANPALPPLPPDLPEAGTTRKRVADLAQAFAQKSTTPTTPPGNKVATSASRKSTGSNNQLADQSTKRGSVYLSAQEQIGSDVNTPASLLNSSKPNPATDSSEPPPPPAGADRLPSLDQSTGLPGEPDLSVPPPPPPSKSAALETAPPPRPSAVPPTDQTGQEPTATHQHAPHPRSLSGSHADALTAKPAVPVQGSTPHPRSMTISGGSPSPSRLPPFPPLASDNKGADDGNGDQPPQRSKPPPPKKLRDSTMSEFIVDLDKKLANSQGNIMGAVAGAANPANDTTDPDVGKRESDVPSLSIAPPALNTSIGGQSSMLSPVSPSPGTYNEFPSSPVDSDWHEPAKESGGLGGLLRRARSPSFSKPLKKDKSSKSKHMSPPDDSASSTSADYLSLSQPGSPNLGRRTPTSLADNTKPEKARPKSLVLNSLGIGNSSTNESPASSASLASSNPSMSAITPNASPGSGNSAVASSGSKGALSWLFKKSDKSATSSSSPQSPPTSPDTAAYVFGGSLAVLGATGVPPLVTMCMTIVNERGPRIEGIYRLSGNAAAIQRHKAAWQQVSTGPAGTPLPDVSAFDVNVVAGTLKLFLRELQDPVLTCDMYPEWVLAGKMEPGAARASVIRALIARLPQAHQDVLRALMWHLHGLSKYADHTKMDTSNFAIVFGPTLVRPRVESMETMVNTEPQNAVVAEMIANVSEYFEPLEADDTKREENGVPLHVGTQIGAGVADASENEPPRSPAGKARPPKGAVLAIPASTAAVPPKLPDLTPMSPIDSPSASREASGPGGLGM